MYRLSWEKEGNSTSPPTGRVDHFCVLQSKRGRAGRWSMYMATMYLPSGDHRGDHKCDDSETTETWPLSTSRMRRSPSCEVVLPLKNKILLPSGDQFGSSVSALSSGTNFCGFPPSD